jgi:hypothetical protein
MRRRVRIHQSRRPRLSQTFALLSTRLRPTHGERKCVRRKASMQANPVIDQHKCARKAQMDCRSVPSRPGGHSTVSTASVPKSEPACILCAVFRCPILLLLQSWTLYFRQLPRVPLRFTPTTREASSRPLYCECTRSIPLGRAGACEGGLG